MPTVAELTAKVSIDSANFDRGLKRADDGMDRLAKNTKAKLSQSTESFKQFGREIRPVLTGIGVGMAAALGFAIKKSIDFDSIKRGLVSVAGSAQEAEVQLKRLRVVAELPGLGFEEAIKGSVRLQAAGLSAKTAEKSLLEFGNALAIVGGGAAELDGVTRALSQIASKGKVTAEEINQIAERVPQIRVAMQEAFGTANTELIQKMGITAVDFIDKMNDALAKGARASGGMKNSLENMQMAVGDAARSIGDALLPTVQRLTDWIQKLAQWFSTLSPRQKEVIALTSAFTLALGLLTAAAVKLWAIFAPLIQGIAAYSANAIIASGATSTLGKAMVALQVTLGPLLVALLAIADAYLIIETFALRAKAAQEAQRGANQQNQMLARKHYIDLAEAAAGNEKRLKDLFHTWIVFQGGVKEKQFALDALNMVLGRSGKMFDAHGNIVKAVTKTYNAAADAAKKLAAAKGGLQPQFTRGSGASSLADGDKAPGGIEFPIFAEDGTLIRNLKELEAHLNKVKEAKEKAAAAALNFGQAIRSVWNETKLLRAHTELARLETEHFINTGEKWTDKQREQMAGALAQRDAQIALNEKIKETATSFIQATLRAMAWGMAMHQTRIEVGKFREELQQTVKTLSDAASESVDQSLTEISEAMRKMRIEAEDWAYAFTDAFLYGLRRIREEGFAGLLHSFEEMLFDMAMAFLRSQLVNLMTSFFSNLLGAFIGGGGGGINIGNGASLPGGQTQTGGGDFGGGNMAHVVNNFYITTPDANSFRQSSAQQQIAALQLATANAMRTR